MKHLITEKCVVQHNNSVTFNNQAPWRDPSVQANPVRLAGPANFRTFPNHHFFVRVYRHNAVSLLPPYTCLSIVSSDESLIGK